MLQSIDTGAPSRSVLPSGHYAAVLRIAPNLGLALATDSVGSKLILAEQTQRFDTIGIDCMAMNVNDLVCVGADPSRIAILDNFCWPDPVQGPKTPDGEHCLWNGLWLKKNRDNQKVAYWKNKSGTALRKPPATAEFVNWVRALALIGCTAQALLHTSLRPLPCLSVLLKSSEDWQLLGPAQMGR